jgi:hypothetical protein
MDELHCEGLTDIEIRLSCLSMAIESHSHNPLSDAKEFYEWVKQGEKDA